MAVATAEPLTVEPLQGAGDTGWLTAHKEANNMGEKKTSRFKRADCSNELT